ncbi:MAG: energy-coupling factor ABC transporter ATP-binding protein [Candidatus Methanomethyliaceae archaeon]|nr:energy-coupling factor ABC transporter ATP-binding protein [Candidatus Methanomethyliaceae archaeon]
MKNIIEIRNLEYTYAGNIKALTDISFDVFEGERLAILGPNGAGKSTLTLLMAGLLRPVEGHVKVFGKDTRSREFENIRRDIGVVFQDPDDQLFNNTVFDDVAYGPRSLGMDENEVKRHVDEALKIMGISHLSDRSPHRLSYGEKKKVAIATTIVMKPKILLLDEPTANLDPKSKNELLTLLKDINREGTTIVLTTHDVEILPDFIERAILMIGGRILASGITREMLYEEQLLRKVSMEPPLLVRLFAKLKSKGLIQKIPLTIDEAEKIVEEALKKSERG